MSTAERQEEFDARGVIAAEIDGAHLIHSFWQLLLGLEANRSHMPRQAGLGTGVHLRPHRPVVPRVHQDCCGNMSIRGDKNVITGDNNVIAADNNVIAADNNVITADNNVITADNNVCAQDFQVPGSVNS